MTQRRVRVLHLLYALGLGGAERHVPRLGLWLDPDCYDIHALTEGPVVRCILPWPQERHTYVSIPSGVPVVLHGEHGRNDAVRISVPWKREFLAAALARLTTRVVAVNDSIAADIQARWQPGSQEIVCMSNGVDLSRFVPCANGARAHGKLFIGTVARFGCIKNLPSLVRAFERTHSAYTHSRLGWSRRCQSGFRGRPQSAAPGKFRNRNLFFRRAWRAGAVVSPL